MTWLNICRGHKMRSSVLIRVLLNRSYRSILCPPFYYIQPLYRLTDFTSRIGLLTTKNNYTFKSENDSAWRCSLIWYHLKKFVLKLSVFGQHYDLSNLRSTYIYKHHSTAVRLQEIYFIWSNERSIWPFHKYLDIFWKQRYWNLILSLTHVFQFLKCYLIYRLLQ